MFWGIRVIKTGKVVILFYLKNIDTKAINILLLIYRINHFLMKNTVVDGIPWMQVMQAFL